MVEDLRVMAMDAVAASSASEDPDYPLFHLAPPVGRLNDPNGLIVRDGEYHACYQFSPFHPHRKLVYWGHASSSDLTHWQHHEPAIVPDSWYDRNGAYSGSAIENEGTVYFAYTGNVREDGSEREAHQSMVTSQDMVSFEKLAENPVISTPIPGYTGHVRDPQVWREGSGFRMCLGAQRENLTGCVLLFASNDLVNWQFEGELQFPHADGRFDDFGYMWECPAFVRVPDEVTGEVHDVLFFCPQGIEPDREGFENIFAACYIIGRLEGTSFVHVGDYHEIDRGFEFYAPQVFAHSPDGPVLLGWAGNASEDDQPSIERGWVHMMTVGRDLAIRDGKLVQRPRLGQEPAAVQADTVPMRLNDSELRPPELVGSRSFAVRAVVNASHANQWRLRIGSEESHIDIEFSGDTMVVDRSSSRYCPAARREVTLPGVGLQTVEVIHDRSITELFVGDGAVAFTMRSYLDPTASGVTLTADGQIGISALTIRRFD